MFVVSDEQQEVTDVARSGGAEVFVSDCNRVSSLWMWRKKERLETKNQKDRKKKKDYKERKKERKIKKSERLKKKYKKTEGKKDYKERKIKKGK